MNGLFLYLGFVGEDCFLELYEMQYWIITCILKTFSCITRYYAKLKKIEEEREQELASKYRDRVNLKCHKILIRVKANKWFCT